MKNKIYNFFVKYFLPKHKFSQGEYIKDLSDTKYRVEQTYYDKNLKPILIVMDLKGNIRSFPDSEVTVTEEPEIW